jgi:hypothetical protein
MVGEVASYWVVCGRVVDDLFGCERYMLARCVRQQHCLTTYESSAMGADDQR